MTYGYLKDLQRQLRKAEKRNDDSMVQCYQREINSVEMLLGEMEMERGKTNV